MPRNSHVLPGRKEFDLFIGIYHPQSAVLITLSSFLALQFIRKRLTFLFKLLLNCIFLVKIRVCLYYFLFEQIKIV